MASQAHVRSLDHLLTFQESRVDEVIVAESQCLMMLMWIQLHAQFEEELQALKDEFLSERDMLIDMHEKEINDIKDIIFAMEVGFT